MKPAMRVMIYPADTQRCGQRLLWPAEALRVQGCDIIVGNDYSRDDPVFENHADVVVMQRPMHRRFVEPFQDDLGRWTSTGAIQMMQADGIRVVVDIDDDFTALHRRNAVWDRTHPANSPDVNIHHLSKACRVADLVTVTTPALARRYGAHGRVAIIPNHIPASYLGIERPDNPVPLVGWTGAVAIHPGDLEVTRGGVSKAISASGAQFHMVGPPDGVQDALGLSEPPSATGFVDLDDYPHEMARIDVGIVPLELSKFNQAKSCLKMTEFSALGVPCIASPTDPNLWFAKRFGGAIATRPRDWEREIKRLVNSPEARIDTGERAREAVKDWTIEKRCEEWFDAWTMPVRRRRAG